MTKEEALKRLMKYCAYRERCHQEVRSKLIELKVYGSDLEEVMVELIGENFLNEERYARSFARGKFKNNSWGKEKIKFALKGKKISDYCIRKAMEEIDLASYEQELQRLLKRKADSLKKSDAWSTMNKLKNYAISKGYSYADFKSAYDQISNKL